MHKNQQLLQHWPHIQAMWEKKKLPSHDLGIRLMWHVNIKHESSLSVTAYMWILYLYHQEGVQMVTSDFAVVQPVTKVEWKSATITHGALCVMTPGVLLMHVLHADSLDSHQ